MNYETWSLGIGPMLRSLELLRDLTDRLLTQHPAK